MHKYFEVLAVRALNSTRNVYPPSYLGLRLLLESLPREGSSDWGSRLISRKLSTRETWRYQSFKELKELNRDGTPAYRDFAIGSPTTALAEATILRRLSHERAFAPHPSAYSYLWPKSDWSGHSYEFYLAGYDRRNRDVSGFLEAKPNLVALVADIRNFYPSVDVERLISKVQRRLAQVGRSSLPDEILCFVKDLLRATPSGIPIGPKLGHLLGHVALEDVDRKMHSEFGSRYLRYVDDIAVVCPKNQVDTAIERLRVTLEEEGLHLNRDKMDVVPSGVWISEVPIMEMPKDAITFGTLLSSLSVYIMRNPESFDGLRSTFRGLGFSLPFPRLKAMSEYGRYRSFIGTLFRQRASWFPPPSVQTDKDLVRMATALRRDTMTKLRSMREREVPSTVMRRRWHVQKYRHLLNSMLYLTDPDEYGELLQLTPDIDEFRENRALLAAFSKKDATGLLPLYGRVVAAFGELWSETETAHPHVDWRLDISEPVANSLGTLAMFRVAEPPPDILESMNPRARELLSYCAGIPVDGREITGLSYLDELRALQLGRNKEELYALFTTRFSDKEDVAPIGIHLGAAGSPGW